MLAGIYASQMMRVSVPAPVPPYFPLLWWDGLDATTFTLSGSDVESWISKGANTATLTPRNAPRCQKIVDGVFFPNSPTTQDSTPAGLVANFGAGVDDDAGSSWTTFVVASGVVDKSSGQSLITRRADNLPDSSANYDLSVLVTTTDSAYSQIRNTGLVQQPAATSSGFDWTSKFSLMSKFGATTATVDIDRGVATGSITRTYFNTNMSYVYLGINVPGSGLYPSAGLRGNIHEVLVYNIELSAPDIVAVNSYLTTKWAL